MKNISDPPATAFDSDEEEWFSWYCEELVAQGMAESWQRARSFPLFRAERRVFHGARKKEAEKDFVLGHEYTPDFEIVWRPEAVGLLTQDKESPRQDDRIPFVHNSMVNGNLLLSVVEVKPFFDRHGKTAWAACQIKWTLQKFDILCQLFKVGSKPNGIFERTFTPAAFLTTAKTKKPRAIAYKPRGVAEFINRRVQQRFWDEKTKDLTSKELAAAIKAGTHGGAVYVP